MVQVSSENPFHVERHGRKTARPTNGLNIFTIRDFGEKGVNVYTRACPLQSALIQVQG
jgi:hypothetical protein